MKTVENNRFVTTVGNFETAEFVVQRHNMRHLMSILRDQLYSDKLLAPIREYSCNAYDANVENGKKDTPIKITLPNSLFPEFKIRDYGKGLTYSEMVNIFCSYGESTKRNSNDFIGQLGIGSKSGFAYGDNFLVASYIDGKKTTYNCVLDKSGVGALLHLTTEETTEPTGLEVTIPVKNSDLLNFKSKALNFFKYWDVYPNIVGIGNDEIKASRATGESILKADGWEIYGRISHSSYANSHIIMGNISYPLNWDLVYSYNDRYQQKFNAFYNFLVNNTVLLRMPIGSIEMAPSREALQYTETTIKAIKNRVDEIVKSMSDIIQKKIADAKNIWDAHYTYGKLFGKIQDDDVNTSASLRTYRDLESCFNGILKWNNIIITGAQIQGFQRFDANHGDVIKRSLKVFDPVLHTFELSRKGVMRAYSSYHNTTITCHPKYKIVINDITDKKGINKNAIRWYLVEKQDSCKCIYYFNFNNDVAKKETFDFCCLNDVPMLKMSDIVAEYKANKPKTVRTKVPKEMVRIAAANLTNFSRYSTALNDFQILDLTQLSGTYVYVEDRTVTINNNKLNVINFLEYASILNKSLNLNITDFYLIGSRIKSNKKFDESKWTNITSLIEKGLKTSTLIDNWIEYTAYINSQSMIDKNKAIVMSKSVMDSISNKITKQDGVFKDILKNYPTINFQSSDKEIYAVRNLGLLSQDAYDAKVKAATEKYKKMWETLFVNYKMIKYISIDFSQKELKLQSTIADEIAEYVNIVDSK